MPATEDLNVNQGSPDRFGYSWDRFSHLSPEQEEQFRRWTAPLCPDRDWNDVHFLDAGCGMGRNSYWPMTYGAASCVAIDIDDRSLSAAQNNLAEFPGARVERCSIYEIPYENEFDITFSIGVIHHLEFPDKAIEQLVKATRPGGKVLIWVYGYENMELLCNFLHPLRLILFSRLPLGLVRFLALFPAAALWLILRLGMLRLEYFKLLRTFPFKHLHSIIFDQMLPRIAHYWRRDEALALLQRADLEDIAIQSVNEMSWAVMGRKHVTEVER